MRIIPFMAVTLSIAVCSLNQSFAAEAGKSTECSSSPFAIRGTLPWHNFLSGPSAWNEDDYRVYLDELAAMKMNFVGFHCYTGGAERYAPYVEPVIRITYRDVLPAAGFDTSLTARWGYRPLAVKDFAFGTSKLFKLPRSAEGFGADCAVTARTNEERYHKAHDLTRKVVKMAHERGLQVAIGFEFGVHPPELASILPPSSRIPGAMMPDPLHPANMEVLRSAVDDILSEYPGVDWVWLWLHEHSMFVGEPKLQGKFKEFYELEKGNFAEAKSDHDIFTGIWSLAQIRQVHEYLAKRSPKTKLVIGGWGGGPQLPPVLLGLDRALPTNIVFSCLNPGMGAAGHVPELNSIAKRRPVWSIPWLEGDGWLWHLQLRASSIIDQVKAAEVAKLAGVVAIHWRTAEVKASMSAFGLAARDPLKAPAGDEFYRQHSAGEFGPESVQELAPLLYKFEVEKQLGYLSSPEFYPYDPSWGRVSSKLADQLKDGIAIIERIKGKVAAKQYKSNLDWLSDNFKFTLLLDEVGRKIEPAYKLKEASVSGDVRLEDLAGKAKQAREQFAAAPVEELFKTFSRRVRSRGELGELSAMNQKLWLEYKELDEFLKESE